MDTPEQKELERFIHAQLQKLPERSAPESLVANVMAAIAAREKLPWWKQSFVHWPRRVQAILFVALAAAVSGFIYGAGRLAQALPLTSAAQHLSSLGWILRTAQSFGESLWLVLRVLPMSWFAALGIVFLVLYAACIATGFALFRVAGAAAARPT